MRKIVVLEFMSLDGVIQGPGGPQEDTSGNFTFGGWTVPFDDDEGGEVMNKQMSMPFDLLLGKKTYDIWAAFWPKQTGKIADLFAKATKYVVAHEAMETSWENTVVMHENVVEELKKIKAGDGPMLQVYGSADMGQTLLEHDLVDELWLKTYPVTLGQGKRLFGDGTRAAAWKLTEPVVVTPSGVIVANYERNGDVKTGSFV